jgi:hypothetical protein
MAEMKTQKTEASVKDFINTITDATRKRDALAMCDLMTEVTGAKPKMWGSSIIGFGDYHYKYESGRENDWFPIGFSPRKQNFALYVMGGLQEHSDLLAKLGKHKFGKGCMYINKLDDVDTAVLKELLSRCLNNLANTKA